MVKLTTFLDRVKKTDAAKSTPDFNSKTLEVYESFVSRGVAPSLVGKQLGISSEIVNQIESQRKLSPNLGIDVNVSAIDSSTRAKQLQDVEAQRLAAQKTVSSGQEVLNADVNIGKELAEGKGLINVDTRGSGILAKVARGLDGLLAGVVDIAPGRPQDWETFDAAAVQDIVNTAKGYGGSISNYENQLFSQDAVGSGRTPEFNRARAAAAVGKGAAVLINQRMAEAINSLRGGNNPLIITDQGPLSPTNRELAVQWLIKSGYLKDASTSVERTSTEYLDVAKSWADFARDPNNTFLVREAILRSVQATKKGTLDLNDPDITAVLAKEGLTNGPVGQPATIDSIEGDVKKAEAERLAGKNAASEAAVTQAATQGVAAGTTQAVEDAQATSATPLSFQDDKAAAAYLLDLSSKNADLPDTFSINGQTVSLPKFADEAAASAYLSDLEAKEQPLPQTIIIGNKLKEVK